MIGGIIRTVRDAAAILRDLGYEVAGEAAAFLLRNVDGSPSPQAEPPPPAAAGSGERAGLEHPADLRKAFARLLERSREARGEPPLHPAFPAILDEITPDEARILRLFDEREEQPLVHVKAIPKYGFGATIVFENFTLVGEDAGCHHPELAPSYVDNLCRLGVLRIHDGRGTDREAYD
ncbi:MAG: Abi-alpha family protein, partial [Candidatus Binatia bacterium]